MKTCSVTLADDEVLIWKLCLGFALRVAQVLRVSLAATAPASLMAATGRNDASASGGLRASKLSRQLSGGESEWAAVAARP